MYKYRLIIVLKHGQVQGVSSDHVSTLVQQGRISGVPCYVVREDRAAAEMLYLANLRVTVL